jgi:ketosteroid isomerase-like protein
MTNTPDPQVRQQLVAYDKTYDEAINKNDAVALAALHTKDAVLVNNRGVIYGREAIDKHWADVFKPGPFQQLCRQGRPEFPQLTGTDGNQMWATGE